MEPLYRLIELSIDKTDLAILNEFLNGEEELTKVLIHAASIFIAKRLKMSEKMVEERIWKMMKEKNLFRKIIPLIDPVKIWNYLFFVFIKADLSPPVVGIPLEYPSGWGDIMNYIKNLIKQDDLFRKNVREGFALQGTEWDVMLTVTTNNRSELREMCEKLVKGKFIEKIWSFAPVEGAGYIFNPISIPSLEDFDEKLIEPIKKGISLVQKDIKK